MKLARFILCFLGTLLPAVCLHAQTDDPHARPPVTKADIDIVKRAAQILNSPAKWNRADTRVCPPDAKIFSLYCALENATKEIDKNFEHRGAAMQEARFVIEEIAPQANRYSHRLMDYNNDPTTSFADIQGVFWLLEKHIAMRLANQQSAQGTSASTAVVTKTDLQVARRVRELLDSPAKWNRSDSECLADAKTFNLICAFEKAEKEIAGTSSDGAAIREARAMISELDPATASTKPGSLTITLIQPLLSRTSRTSSDSWKTGSLRASPPTSFLSPAPRPRDGLFRGCFGLDSEVRLQIRKLSRNGLLGPEADF